MTTAANRSRPDIVVEDHDEDGENDDNGDENEDEDDGEDEDSVIWAPYARRDDEFELDSASSISVKPTGHLKKPPGTLPLISSISSPSSTTTGCDSFYTNKPYSGPQMTLSVPRYVLLNNRRHSADLFTRSALG